MNISNHNELGLSNRDLETITNIFKKYENINEVIIFGSRAKGNFKIGSDIDLAILDTDLDNSTLLKLKSTFEESSLPYYVDIIITENLNNPNLLQNILKYGKIIYTR